MHGPDTVVSIRLATTADLPELMGLYKLLDIEPKPDMPVEQAWARFVELTAKPGHHIYVAELDAQVVGTFALVFVGGLPHRARDSCIVEDVVVARDRQGSGIGRAMMKFAMNQCADRDCYKLVLSSHLQRARAHEFYEGLGFSKHGYSFLITRFDGQ